MEVGFKRTKKDVDFTGWWFDDDLEDFNKQIEAALNKVLAKRLELVFGNQGSTSLHLSVEGDSDGLQVVCDISFDVWGAAAFAKASLLDLIRDRIKYGDGHGVNAASVAKELKAIAAELELSRLPDPPRKFTI